MGLIDAFAAETKVDIRFSDFYKLVVEVSKAELMMNAVNCNVPHEFIRETMTGKMETAKGKETEEPADE